MSFARPRPESASASDDDEPAGDARPWACGVLLGGGDLPDDQPVGSGLIVEWLADVRLGGWHPCGAPSRYKTAVHCPRMPNRAALKPTCDEHTADLRAAAVARRITCSAHGDAPHCEIVYVTSGDPATVRSWPPPPPTDLSTA